MQGIIPCQDFLEVCLSMGGKQGDGTSAPLKGNIAFGLFLGKSYSSISLIISYFIITDPSPKYIHRENFSGFFEVGEIQDGDYREQYSDLKQCRLTHVRLLSSLFSLH